MVVAAFLAVQMQDVLLLKCYMASSK